MTRQRKKAKVREAIIRAAVDLFERRGFELTTIDEIAARAEVSSRTFFRYFPSKDAVMFPYHEAYIERFRGLLRDHRAAGSPMETLRRSLGAMADTYMAARDEHLRLQRIIASSPALMARSIPADAQWEAAIEKAWRADSLGSAKDGMRARLVAGAVMGVINAVMARWYEGGCREDLRKLGASALDLLERGIGDGADESP